MKNLNPRRGARSAVLAGALAAAIAVAGLAGSTDTGGVTGLGLASAAHRQLLAAPGRWTLLAEGPNLVTGQSTPSMWVSSTDTALVVWQRRIKNNFTYETVSYSAKGVAGTPSEALNASDWTSLLSGPPVIPDGSEPLIVFEGAGSLKPYNDGCVIGDLLTASGWKLQPWSLSANCNIPGLAAANVSGVISAAWPGGGWNTKPIDHGVQYRIGPSSSFPAAGLDGRIPAATESSNVYKTSEASDRSGNRHLYVVWALTASPDASAGGLYVKDVTANSPTQKVPGTGETSATPNIGVFSPLPVTNTNTHGGVWILYCTNTPVCSLRMWRPGGGQPLDVPHSAHAENYAISAGPDGRLWVSWTSSVSPYEMYTTRTNKADTRFGPVVSYKEPCESPGWLALTSGSFARVDVAMMCTNTLGKFAEYAMRTMAELSFAASKLSITNTKGNSVTFWVNDARDPVAGATVSVAGVNGKTSASGYVTLKFPAGFALGKHGITVSAPDYYAAHGTLVVKS